MPKIGRSGFTTVGVIVGLVLVVAGVLLVNWSFSNLSAAIAAYQTGQTGLFGWVIVADVLGLGAVVSGVAVIWVF